MSGDEYYGKSRTGENRGSGQASLADSTEQRGGRRKEGSNVDVWGRMLSEKRVRAKAGGRARVPCSRAGRVLCG